MHYSDGVELLHSAPPHAQYIRQRAVRPQTTPNPLKSLPKPALLPVPHPTSRLEPRAHQHFLPCIPSRATLYSPCAGEPRNAVEGPAITPAAEVETLQALLPRSSTDYGDPLDFFSLVLP